MSLYVLFFLSTNSDFIPGLNTSPVPQYSFASLLNILIPEFKNENYYGGVVNAVKVIKQKLDKKIDEL